MRSAPTSRLHIALVSPYDSVYAGGVTEHVNQLAHHFRQWGHSVKVIAPSSQRVVGDPDFIPVGRVTPVAVNGSVARVSLSVMLAPQIRRILARERFDVVHVHEPLSPTLPTTFLSCSDAVNVGTFHASATRSIGYTFVQHWLQRVEQKLTGRIAVSAAAREFANRYFPADYAIIPNGVDVETYSRPAPAFPLPGAGPTVLFVGRFNEERKGFRYLLDAMSLVQRSRPDARLIVAGGGDPTPFRALIRQAQLRNVQFVGYVTKQQLAALYQTTTVFCAPSTGGESFGIVLLEAMAAGAAIVAADNPGYRDVLEHRRQGLLVPAQSAEALAVGILQLLDDRASREAMAAAGRAKSQHYAWDRVAGRVFDYYTHVRA
ncbi:MAG TPA: glycosyltransferase family 4 protein [Herpetosiphonaceae bacterium]|nr:glycosyltransferase family 4 protein [Herpetosiphonaceae bacterium]